MGYGWYMVDPMLSVRLREACSRKFQSLNTVELAARFGVNEHTFQAHYHGKRGFKKDTAQSYADKLGVTANWLLFGETESQQIPLIDSVAAGAFADTTDPYAVGDENTPIVEFPSLPHSHFIALKVEGTSMNLVAPEGSYIAVDLTVKKAHPGRYYVIRKDSDKATFKRFEQNPDRYEPESSEKHGTIFADSGKIYIVGQVRKALMDL